MSPRRPHCTCIDVQNMTIEAAAERLGCRERLLRDTLPRLTHQKFGDQRVMCPCEVRLAMAHFTEVPAVEAAPDSSNVTEIRPPAADPLHSIRPSTGRRTSSR